MAVSEAKRRANDKYDRAHYTRATCKIRKEDMERFKAKCESIGTTPNATIKGFIKEFIESAGDSPAAGRDKEQEEKETKGQAEGDRAPGAGGRGHTQ